MYMINNNKYLFTSILFCIIMQNNQSIAENNANFVNTQVQQSSNQVINKIDPIKTKLQEILNMVITLLKKGKHSTEDIYNALSGSVYKYIKHNNISASDLNNTWKSLLNSPEYQNEINTFKQKLSECSKSNEQKYSIDSISEITTYYLNYKYPNKLMNILTNVFSSQNWIDVENNYDNFVKGLISVNTDILQQDINTVISSFMKQFTINREKLIASLKQLQNTYGNFESKHCIYNIKHYEQPLFMSKLQNHISSVTEFSDMATYVVSNSFRADAEYFESELDYVLYYIKTGNDWAIQYITKYINDCITNINNNNNNEQYNIELGAILNEIDNSEYKDKYSNITASINNRENIINVYQNNKGKKIEDIKNQSNVILKTMEDRANEIKKAQNKDEFFDAVSKFTRALERQINRLVESESFFYQKELLNDLITNTWQLCTINNIINTIITGLQKYSNTNTDAFKNLYEILNSESFKTSEPFIQFKKIINWRKKVLTNN